MYFSYGDLFVDQNEVPLFSLENGNLMNVVSGEGIKKETAIITDKRLYYTHKRGILNIVSEDEKIDPEDITGTKIIERNPTSLLIFAAIAFIVCILVFASEEIAAGIGLGLVIALALIISYFSLHKKYLYIEYAGGNIHFSLIGYKKENISNFQNTIYFAKDKLKQANKG